MEKKYFLVLVFVLIVLVTASCGKNAEISRGIKKCLVYKASGAADSCLAKLGLSKKEISVCKSANMPDYCSWAVYSDANEPSMCAELSNNSRDKCFFHVAPSRKNASLCSLINRVQLRDLCIVYVVGLSKEAGACNAVINQSLRDKCYGFASNGSAELCPQISDIGIRDGCYVASVASKQDAKICIMISLPENKNTCYTILSALASNISLCENIQYVSAKEFCLAGAYRLADAGKCSLLSQAAGDACLSSIAMKSNNKSICTGIQDSRILATCTAIRK